MPRKNREKSATGIYHVMLRGINRQDIFEDAEDYKQFIKMLRLLVDRKDDNNLPLPPLCTVYAYCLMSNHVHLLIREKCENIGESIKRIGVAYARYFNRKNSRVGHLFQDRFQSEPVNDIAYFGTLMKYIHQNPVKAGLAKEVRDYPWSSWAEYERRGSGNCICNREAVIRRLGWQNLYEFVCTPANGHCILDVDNQNERNMADADVIAEIKKFYGIDNPTDIQKLEKNQRDDLLRQLCLMGVKVRQLSRITGISYGTINRAKSGSAEPSP